MDTLVKTCSRCLEVKPTSAFQRRRASSDGLQPRCKACAAEYKKQHYRANRDRILVAAKAYNQTKPKNPRPKLSEPERLEARRRKSRRYKQRHAAKIAAQKAAYRAAHPEKAADQWRQWSTANPERAKASSRRWRAAKFAAHSEPYLRSEVWAKTDGLCGICFGELDPVEGWQIDHIVPLSRGGDDTLANTQPAHARCNQSKGNRVA